MKQTSTLNILSKYITLIDVVHLGRRKAIIKIAGSCKKSTLVELLCRVEEEGQTILIERFSSNGITTEATVYLPSYSQPLYK
jgi:hypothetical protein